MHVALRLYPALAIETAAQSCERCLLDRAYEAVWVERVFMKAGHWIDKHAHHEQTREIHKGHHERAKHNGILGDVASIEHVETPMDANDHASRLCTMKCISAA